MKNNGMVKVASIVPKNVYIGDVKSNLEEIKKLISLAIKQVNLNLIVFPELALTGYTCGDLFNQSILNTEVNNALITLNYFMKEFASSPVVLIGCPIRKDNQLFNCAAIFDNTGLLGFVPKTYIPNYNEFYEARYFSSSINRVTDSITIDNKEYPFTPNLLIKDNKSEMILGVDICEDLWVPIPPSKYHCLHSANVIANLSASNETIGKSKYREDLIKMHTATSLCGYVYTSAGKDESTTDTVFSGHTIIACNGNIVKSENELITRNEIIFSEIDVEKCINDRSRSTSYMGVIDNLPYTIVDTSTNYVGENVNNILETPFLTPFVPSNIDERANEIMNIQANGLAQRLKKIHCEKVVLGISGGLDSTLALLVAIETFKILNLDMKGIIGITMPAFGTTNRTKNNSIKLMDELGITSYEIDIKEMCDAMYKGMNYDKSLLDVTFENVQARTRTEILMNMANKENGIVIGTGDLSELALGWCTYNGDQMSMYGVNVSIPKTLVRSLVSSYANVKANKEVKEVLLDICDTPISPELLPPNEDGSIAQKTEESIGSYVIHDFTLYYMMRYGFSPRKIYFLCLNAMLKDYKNLDKKEYESKKELFSKEIIDNMKIFYKRFFQQQFKRSCMPDGVKVGSISLSPRADWRMPSDANANLWLDEVNSL